MVNAEMATGEGKTWVYIACYLNALPGEGVHIVTVTIISRVVTLNGTDLLRMLGLTVDCIDNINRTVKRVAKHIMLTSLMVR